MTLTKGEVDSVFGHRLRVRACGICLRQGKILLVKHSPLGEKGYLWAPPGGGMEFGETAEESVVREIEEETGLIVHAEKLLFVHEYLKPPLHALELFFLTPPTGGFIKRGQDPEIPENKQMIREVKFFGFDEIKTMDKDTLHNIFSIASSEKELLAFTGYFRQKTD